MSNHPRIGKPKKPKAHPDLFTAGATRLAYDDAVEMTIASLAEYGPRHDHWCIAWSGGKDSTALVTLVVHLIEVGRLAPPKSLTVLFTDTRQELLPLMHAADQIRDQIQRRSNWIKVETLVASLDDRFLVYMLGRGVPPPTNKFRWCTPRIKVEPMIAALERHLADLPGDILMLTGVRKGESAVRDQRIEVSCSRDDGECGQGWFQVALPEAKGVRGRINTLAPLLHWRVCTVWDWLRVYAPLRSYGGWATAGIAEAYGGEPEDEALARTGCVGCPLVAKDMALERVVRQPGWAYLAPLRRLKGLYAELRETSAFRLRKTGMDEAGQALTGGKGRQRKGPLTFDARLHGLDVALQVQAEVNAAADTLGRPRVDFLNAEEEARIRELIALKTWPNGWDGDEPTSDAPLDAVLRDGSVQPLLFGRPVAPTPDQSTTLSEGTTR